MNGRTMKEESRQFNFGFNALPIKQKSGVEIVITGLQLVLAIVLLGLVIWAGDAIATGIESALGEKPLRDRDA